MGRGDDLRQRLQPVINGRLLREDIEARATNLARAMVTEWGMSEKLGPLHFYQLALKAPAPLLRSVAFSPNGQLLAGATATGPVVWDLADGYSVRHIAGEPVEATGTSRTAGRAVFHGVARAIDDETPDPRVLVERERTVRAGGMTERVRLRNGLEAPSRRAPLLAPCIGLALSGS